MNLPTISHEYTWQIETALHTERLGRNQIRVTLLERKYHRLLRRVKPVMSKTITLKDSAQREAKIERAARKMWKKFQVAAYQQNMREYAAYNNSADLSRSRLGLDQRF